MAGRYKAYPDYKESHTAELGCIPSHWKTSKVRYLSYCLDGKRIPLNGSERGEMQGQIPYWGANSIVDYVNNYIFDEDLILLGEDGAPFFDATRKVAFFVQGKVWPNNHVHVLRPRKDKVKAQFLAYALNCVDYHLYITGSTRDKLNQSAMNDIALRLPTYDEQQKIASFLDHETAKIDTLIAKQEKLIELLKEKRQAVISHAVTKGLNPNAPMRDSGVEWLGEVPEHWVVAGFKKFIEKIVDYRGKTPNKTDSGVFLVTARNIKKGVVDYSLSNEFISEDDYSETMSRGKPNIGDVLFTTEAPLGEVANVDNTDIALAQRIIKFSGKKDILDNYFFKYFMMSEAFQTSLSLYASGSTVKGIKAERLVYLRKLIPPLAEQKEITHHIDIELKKFDLLVSKAEVGIELIKERKTALISAAVTGKIDVRDFVSEQGQPQGV